MNQWLQNCVYETRREIDGRFFPRFFSRDWFFFHRSLIFRKCQLSIYVFNPKHPTRLYRAFLRLRKRVASKPSCFLPLQNSPREKLSFLVLSMYTRIYALIQLNETIFSYIGRGKFRPHPRLGFAKISSGFQSNTRLHF